MADTAEQLQQTQTDLKKALDGKREMAVLAVAALNSSEFHKACYYDELVEKDLLTSIRETANLLEVPEKEFIRWMLAGKFLYRGRRDKLRPYSNRIEEGLFKLKETSDDGTPRSFVEQALARCSVDGAKLWFNCNPDVPEHWFRKEWLLKLEEKNADHLHFTMDDNPSLSEETRAMYRSLYAGVFYRRYILGEWTAGDGLIYDMFDPAANTYGDEERPQGLPYLASRCIACDYGTANPTVFLDIYDDGNTVWVDGEYRWDSRDMEHCGRQKTDAEYAGDLQAFMGADPQFFCPVVADPSAASFIAELERRGVYAIAGDNDVLNGIRRVSQLFARRALKVNRRCRGLIGELQSYAWDTKAAQMLGVERPVKQMDHAPDALRYYVNTCLPKWRYGEE